MLLNGRNYKECREDCFRYDIQSRMWGIVRGSKKRRRRRSWRGRREGVGEERKTRGGEGESTSINYDSPKYLSQLLLYFTFYTSTHS
jgi:hypothetical protein